MNKFTFTFLFSLLLIKVVFASNEPIWPISGISNELKIKSNAVIRNLETIVTVTKNGSVEEDVKITTTILNENGKQYGYFMEFYDKFSSISGLHGVLYDKNGKLIRKIKSSDFNDNSAIPGFSIYADSRLKFASPDFGEYPYTVEYEYKRNHKSFFSIPGWQIIPGYNISIQKASYKLILEYGANIKFKGNDKFNITPVISETIDSKSFLWQTENQPAIDLEPLSSALTDFTPVLYVVPEKFKMDNHAGSNLSWIDFGNWIYALSKGKDALPEQAKEKIRNLVLGVNSDIDKAKILYEYLQNKVRYVSIQVGIGGYEPFPAETVDKLSYGDCKALAYYMKTILEIVGINSYYCLVNAGSDSPNIDKNFVSNQFNHAFLMLPLKTTDTLYLECTSQLVPFGYNGTFTDNRDILVVDSAKSYIQHTNIYPKEKNKIINNYLLKIDNNLNCNVLQTSKYIGVASENIRYLMLEKPEYQRLNVLKRFKFHQAKISVLGYVENKDITPSITETIEYQIAQVGQATNNNSIIIPFNQVTSQEVFKRVNIRKSDIVILRESIQIDSIKFDLPKSFKVDKLPKANSLSSAFGAYKLEVINNEKAITFIRSVEWKKGKFSPEQYTDLIQYQRKINEMDGQVLILK